MLAVVRRQAKSRLRISQKNRDVGTRILFGKTSARTVPLSP